MELLLNVVWMLTTLGFLIAWRFCWIPQKGKSLRNSLQELAAIVCTLVILFFRYPLPTTCARMQSSPMTVLSAAVIRFPRLRGLAGTTSAQDRSVWLGSACREPGKLRAAARLHITRRRAVSTKCPDSRKLPPHSRSAIFFLIQFLASR